jgi:hypothetical protein
MIREMGFEPFAAPIARTALGLPILFAIIPYEQVSPNGIEISAFHTSR